MIDNLPGHSVRAIGRECDAEPRVAARLLGFTREQAVSSWSKALQHLVVAARVEPKPPVEQLTPADRWLYSFKVHQDSKTEHLEMDLPPLSEALFVAVKEKLRKLLH